MQNIHIGFNIKERAEFLRITPIMLAKLINKSASNVYHIYNNGCINTSLLIIISKVLDYNFFDDYSFEFK